MTDSEAIVRKFFEQAFNGGHLDAIDALVSPDFVEHQTLGPNVRTGRDAPRAVVESLRRGFSDFHVEIEDMVSRALRQIAAPAPTPAAST